MRLSANRTSCQVFVSYFENISRAAGMHFCIGRDQGGDAGPALRTQTQDASRIVVQDFLLILFRQPYFIE